MAYQAVWDLGQLAWPGSHSSRLLCGGKSRSLPVLTGLHFPSQFLNQCPEIRSAFLFCLAKARQNFLISMLSQRPLPNLRSKRDGVKGRDNIFIVRRHVFLLSGVVG